MLAEKMRRAATGRERAVRGVILPAENAAEAAVVDRLDVLGVNFVSDELPAVSRAERTVAAACRELAERRVITTS